MSPFGVRPWQHPGHLGTAHDILKKDYFPFAQNEGRKEAAQLSSGLCVRAVPVDTWHSSSRKPVR
jgi:hypothetical protein